MYYSIILYIVFILPISIRKYNRYGKRSVLIKILNSLATLYVCIALSGITGRLIPWNSEDSIRVMKNLPLWANIIYSVVYVVVSAYAILLVARLAFMLERARTPFLRIIPLLWVLTSIEKYYTYISMFNEIPSLEFVIINNTLNIAIWGGIFVFYRNKKTKEFFLAS